jgi:hypothetical protein
LRQRPILIVLALLLLVLCSVRIRAWLRHREQVQAERCLANLAFIESADEAVALSLSLSFGATIPRERVEAAMGAGGMPTCPAGGQYVISVVGVLPRCTVHGDLLMDRYAGTYRARGAIQSVWPGRVVEPQVVNSNSAVIQP